MQVPGLSVECVALPAPLPVWHAQVSGEEWLTAGAAVRHAGGRLLALWAGAPLAAHATQPADATDAVAAVAPACMCASYATLDGAFWLAVPLVLVEGQPVYPDLAPLFPAAGRMQRAAADLSGVHAQGASDTRPWLNHGAWPADYVPLQQPAGVPQTVVPTPLTDYPFVRVEGDGVHEIAVGPVHAGIIEPGHFRFSVVGEKVLRLEQRLGYTHKGVEQRMTQLPPLQPRAWPGGCRATPPWPMPGPIAWRWSRPAAPPSPSAHLAACPAAGA